MLGKSRAPRTFSTGLPPSFPMLSPPHEVGADSDLDSKRREQANARKSSWTAQMQLVVAISPAYYTLGIAVGPLFGRLCRIDTLLALITPCPFAVPVIMTASPLLRLLAVAVN